MKLETLKKLININYLNKQLGFKCHQIFNNDDKLRNVKILDSNIVRKSILTQLEHRKKIVEYLTEMFHKSLEE